MSFIGTICMPLYTSSFGLRSFFISVKEMSVASSGLSRCCISFTSALFLALLKSSSVCDNRNCETTVVSLFTGRFVRRNKIYKHMAVSVDNRCLFAHRSTLRLKVVQKIGRAHV